jgi:hypothetical protein
MWAQKTGKRGQKTAWGSKDGQEGSKDGQEGSKDGQEESKDSRWLVENLPDVLDVHIDDESELHSLHEHLLLYVGQGQPETQAVDLNTHI